MSLTVVRGPTNKPASSTCLIDILSNQDALCGRLFVGFPIIRTRPDPRTIDAMLVSPDRGIVLFDLIEGHCPGNFAQRQDDAANSLESRLRMYPELLHRRSLKMEISTLSFAPALPSDITDDHGYVVKTRSSLTHALLSIECPEYASRTYRFALSALENVSNLRTHRTCRKVDEKDSRGYKLKKLEESIVTLDSGQSRAVVETVDGVQRIRGISGSGKTLVLALKAAYLHALNPDWKIAVTLYKPALEGQFRDHIQKFMLEQTGMVPEWSKLRILGPWGIQGPMDFDESGIYAQYCEVSGAEYMDYSEARSRFGVIDPFEQVCRDALLKTKHVAIDPLYDTIIVDDAQEMSPYFLRICHRILDSNKRLTFAYDELNPLNKVFPSPEYIFKNAQPKTGNIAVPDAPIDTLKSDVLLPICYRNSRPLLVTAHSIRFGIYRESEAGSSTNLVQMFDNPKLWEDIGYEVKSGVLNENQTVRLWRPEHSTPRFLEDHSRIDDIIQFHRFEDIEEQIDWLIKSIVKNLDEDQLRPSDILVINPNPITTRTQLGSIRARLLRMEIDSHFVGVDSYSGISPRRAGSLVTFTGINRAEAEEAAMVYIINAHDGLSNRHGLSTVRNRLFTAITRSKAWARVLGVGPDMQRLIQESDQLQGSNFQLEFRYPTLEERSRLQKVYMDVSETEEMQHKKMLVDEVISDYEEGRLDVDSKHRLERVVSRQANFM